MEHYQVTLTTGGTAYEIRALIKAINAAFQDTAKQWILQSDDGNSAAIHFGGSGVTVAAYGTKLVAADEALSINATSLGGLYAISGTNSQKVNILVIR